MKKQSRWFGRFWARVLTLLVLLFAIPGNLEVVQEALSLVADAGCCSDGSCDEDDGQCNPQTCTHCACCAHLNAVPAELPVIPDHARPNPQKHLRGSGHAYASGYRAALFRPPAA